MAAQEGQLIGFAGIALRGWWKIVFIGLPLLIPGLLMSSFMIASTTPPVDHWPSDEGGRDITVAERIAEVRLTISCTFHLVPVVGGGWTTIDGVNDTSYSFRLEDKKSGVAASGNGKFFMHSFFEDEDGDPDNGLATHTESKTYTLDIPKGDYFLNVTATKAVDVRLAQKSTLEQQSLVTTWLAVLLTILLVGATITILNKRDRENARMLEAAYPELFRPQNRPAAGTMPTGQYSQVPTPVEHALQPVPGGEDRQTGPKSSLEYVQGNYVVENYCAKCGMLIRGQPVNGILTCEHCGAQNRGQGPEGTS